MVRGLWAYGGDTDEGILTVGGDLNGTFGGSREDANGGGEKEEESGGGLHFDDEKVELEVLVLMVVLLLSHGMGMSSGKIC